MDAIDYIKPIMFRPTQQDREVLELLAEKNPVLSATTPDLIRVALQDYLFNHGPQSGRSKNARLDKVDERLDRIDRRFDQVDGLLEAICAKLNIPT